MLMFASLKNSQRYAEFRHARWQLQKAAAFEYHRLRARLKRSRSKATYIGVTGSSGKTTTTALAGHLLSAVDETHVQAVTNQLRAFIGALTRTPSHRGYSIWEMGASKPGSIKPVHPKYLAGHNGRIPMGKEGGA
ncbi:MAG: hypothetical protein ACR2PG_25585 [Hyphomicrobiaceae bacterium]